MNVCVAEVDFKDTSLAALIVSLDVWEVPLIVPSSKVYSLVMSVAGVQSTPEIWLGISLKTHVISWFSTAYTFSVLGVMATSEIV